MAGLGIGSLNAQSRTYELVLEQLRNAIIDGTLKQGSPLRTADLANELGVSRTPVREALHRLEAEGLVIMQPYRGATVAPLSVEGVRDAYELLSVIEALAAREAAKHISDKQLAELDAALEELDRVRLKEDTAAYSAANRAFHSAVYELYDNERAHEIMSELWNYVYRIRHAYPQSPTRMAAGMKQHRALVEALREHDPAKAEAVVRSHVEDSLEKLLKQIEQRPDPETVIQQQPAL